MIWYAKKWKVNVCGWLIHGTICWILLFPIWQSELCGQHCVRYYPNQIVLNTLWNSYLNKATKTHCRRISVTQTNLYIPRPWSVSGSVFLLFLFCFVWGAGGGGGRAIEEMSRTHEERKGEEASSPLHVLPSRGLWLDNYRLMLRRLSQSAPAL